MKSNSEQFTKVAFSTLDMTTNFLQTKSTSKQKKKKLNLFGKGITQVKILTQQEIHIFKEYHEIDLSHNALSSIQNLKTLPIIQLNLSHNKLNDQEKLLQLFVLNKNCELCKNIQKIMFKGNPFLKKNLISEFKRWLFSVQNDLDLFSKEQLQFLEHLVQRVIQNLTLKNLLNRITINTQFIRDYHVQMTQDYQELLLLRPQDYFKILKRQMQWKLQVQPIKNVKRDIVMHLPIQIFIGNKQRTKFSSHLSLELRTRNQNLIKQNKQILQKIESSIFNYLTLKKMNLDKKQKTGFSKLQTMKTPLKQICNFKQFESSSSYPQINTSSSYPQINTAIYAIRHSPRQKSKMVFSQQIQSPNSFILTSDNRKMVKTYQLQKIERNPFEQIIQETGGDQNKLRAGQKYQSKYKKIQSPRSSNLKMEIKKSSKTLFQLSQSLLQKPIVTSDDSLHFEMGQQGTVSQSQIQKMFNQILIKINPVYHLLYSPLTSLKSKQKDQLIASFSDLVKQKLKHIQKMQKYKVIADDQQTKIDRYTKQLAKRNQQIQIKNSKIDRFQIQLANTQLQLKTLSTELQKVQQQSFGLRNQNQYLNNKLQKFQQIKLTRDQQETIEQKIRENNQIHLKRNYLKLVMKKAQKYNTFRINTEILKKQQNKNTKREYFLEWKQQVQLQSKQRQLTKYILSQNFNQWKSTLQKTLSIQIKQKISEKLLVNFIKFENFHQMVTKYRNCAKLVQKLYLAEKHYQRKIKIKLFQVIRQNMKMQKDIQYDQIVKDFKVQSKKRLKLQAFREWLYYIKGLSHKQIEIRVNHQGILACNIIQNLCNYYSYEKSFKNKSLALNLHLKQIRKITYFHQLHKHISLENQKWKLKLFKINMFTKRTFFQAFFEGVRSLKLKRKIKHRDEQLTKRKLQFNQPSQFKIRRRINLIKNKNKLRNCYFLFVKNKIHLSKIQYQTQKKLQMYKRKQFFAEFQNFHKQKQQFNSKKKQLFYLSQNISQRQYKNTQFNVHSLFDFMKKQHQFKHQLTLFFIRKNKRLMYHTFYQLRITCIQSRAIYFQQKLRQLGPDIQIIEQRQIQTNIQKVSLLRDVQLKNQQLQDYQKQVNELKLLLQAKQIKYEKLKDIYAQSIQINSRQRQIYELQSCAQYPNLQLQIERNLLRDRLIPHKEDNFQKTIRFDSKKDILRPMTSKYDLHSNKLDLHNNKQVMSYTNKYSPERDVNMPRQKKKISDFVLQSKQFINRAVSRQNIKNLERPYNNDPKDTITQFYPSFRRF